MGAPIDPGVKTLLNSFGSADSNQYRIVYNALTDSPTLAKWFNNAVGTGELGTIEYSSDNPNSVMNFTGNTLNVFKGFLDGILSLGGVDDNFTIASMVFQLGHETLHADTAGASDRVDQWRDTTLKSFKQGISDSNDATTVVSEYQDIHLKDEGSANIRGWTDVVSYANASGINVASLESSVGYTLFSSDGPHSGITAGSDGSVLSSPENILAAAQFEGHLHPSFDSSDKTATYYQFYGAGAINEIIAATHSSPIKLDYHALHFDVSTYGDIGVDNITIDAHLIESGLTETTTGYNITDTGSGEYSPSSTNPFQIVDGLTTASVIYDGDQYATDHVVVSNSHDIQEFDEFDGSSGNLSTRDLFTYNAGKHNSETFAYFSSGDPYAVRVNHFGADGALLSGDSFDSVSGRLLEHEQYTTTGSGGVVSTYFLDDGSRSVNVMTQAATGLREQESADFGVNAQHASDIWTYASDNTSMHEGFDSSGNLQYSDSYDSSLHIVEQDQYTSGILASLYLAYVSPSISSETWTFDSASGEIKQFQEAGSSPSDWIKQSDGSWLETYSHQTSASTPSLPSMPTLLPVLNADELLSQSDWIAPNPMHSIDAIHL